MRLIQVSDIHYQLDWKHRSWRSSGLRGLPGRFELHILGRLSRFTDGSATWQRILEDIETLKVDHVILTGDLTAMGALEELEAVRASVSHLISDGRLTLIPGNHDRYTDTPRQRYFERVFANQLVSAMPEYADARGYPFVRLVGTDTAFIGLDSTRVPGWSQYVAGRVGAVQLSALTRILDDTRVIGRTAHVLCHHGPLTPEGKRAWRESELVDGAALLSTLKGRQVLLYHGHSHFRFWQRRNEDHPHVFGGGSSTEPGHQGYWLLDVKDAQHVDAHQCQPGSALKTKASENKSSVVSPAS